MNAAIVGIGLIGGSLALSLKKSGLFDTIIGVESNSSNVEEALQLGLVDQILPLEEAVKGAKLIVLAIPVNVIPTVAIKILNRVDNTQVLMDMGSTKWELCEVISLHPNRGRFVATHPMWGTEYSGPSAAQSGAFVGCKAVICEKEKSDADAYQFVEKLYEKLEMVVTYMEAEEHDVHAAYVSHISHLTSFALSLTVLEKELEDENITTLSGGGFDSTVRLAKSSPEMWLPIFMQNKYNLLDVLREHIHQLNILRRMIEKDDHEGIKRAMRRANEIRRVLK